MSESKKWVMTRFSALGDVTLTTGVLAHFHASQGHTFTVLTREAFAPLFEHHPAVTEVLPLPPRPGFRALMSWFRALAQRFAGQGLLDLHDTPRTRLLALLWQGPVRRYPKYSLERRLLLLRQTLLGSALPQHGNLSRTTVPQRYASALQNPPPAAQALVPRVFLTAEERAEGQQLATSAASNGTTPLIALHPYATHANKEWPAESWRALMAALEARNLPWVVIGRRTGGAGRAVGAEDGQNGQTLFPDLPATRDFTNRTTLRQTCALLAASGVLVTGDSGPLHLASAVQTPVVALFGPTVAEWGFFPQGRYDTVLQQSVPCRPCSLHGQGACAHEHVCMNGITPEQVLHAVECVLAKV